MLTPTDWLNIICFVILYGCVAIVGIAIVKKVKRPYWKLQVGLIAIHEIAGVILLISRLVG